MGDELMEQAQAARELLHASKRSLQLVEERIAQLSKERRPVTLGTDVSSEHRFAMFGAVDALTEEDGIDLGSSRVAADFNLTNPHRGIIRVQEDAAFVVTDIMVATTRTLPDPGNFFLAQELFWESPWYGDANRMAGSPYGLSLVDSNTGRTLTPGLTVGPLDRDRGVVPFDYISSFRQGLGSNIKNRLFAEFTIPRAGTVNVNVFRLGRLLPSPEAEILEKAYVTLLGFKVFGA